MKKSIVTSIRLTPAIFEMFRALMQLHGRAWLERIIEREYNRAKDAA